MEGDCNSCKKWEEHYYWNHLDVKRMHFYKVMIGDFSQHMSIPKKFMEHFKGELSEIVDLKDPSGNKWHVGLMKTTGEMFLHFGWKEFVKAHHIEENDLLVFKYDGNSCFEILMFDKSGCEKATSYFVKSNDSEKQERSDDSVEVLDINSRCKVIVCNSSSSSRDGILQALPLSIPCKISRQNPKPETNYRRAGSSCGKRISRSNELFVHPKNKRGKPRKNVDFLKGTKYHIKQEFIDLHKKLARPNLYISRNKPLTDAEEKKAFQLANAVQTDNPCFISFMRPSNVGKGRFLTIPSRFAAAHLPPQSWPVFLQIPGRRKKWCVKYVLQKSTSGLCGQWRCFALDNNLEEGDACLFELMEKHRDVVMTVHIIRAADK